MGRNFWDMWRVILFLTSCIYKSKLIFILLFTSTTHVSFLFFFQSFIHAQLLFGCHFIVLPCCCHFQFHRLWNLSDAVDAHKVRSVALVTITLLIDKFPSSAGISSGKVSLNIVILLCPCRRRIPMLVVDKTTKTDVVATANWETVKCVALL